MNKSSVALRFIFFTTIFNCAILCLSQQEPSSETGPIRSSPAYSEILLRKTELQADLEALSADYTEANPKIVDLRFELGALDKSLEKIFGVKPTETGKLTLALGKLIVRKAALETELSRLTRNYSQDHPEVKRAKRRVEIFDAAIKEVLR
jgi:uncharacterized protein involved in exopolysaccharide biosynthesis